MSIDNLKLYGDSSSAVCTGDLFAAPQGIRLTASHGSVALGLHLVQLRFQQASRAGSYGFLRLGIEEVDKEEWNVVLPRYATKRGKVRNSQHIAIAILRVGHLEFFQIGPVVHVPAENDGAEAEPVLSNGQEFLLGNELAAEYAVDVDARKLDAGVVG